MTDPRWEVVITGSGEVRDQDGKLLSFDGMYNPEEESEQDGNLVEQETEQEN